MWILKKINFNNYHIQAIVSSSPYCTLYVTFSRLSLPGTFSGQYFKDRDEFVLLLKGRAWPSIRNRAPFEIPAATNTAQKVNNVVVIFKQIEAFLTKSVCFSDADPGAPSVCLNESHLDFKYKIFAMNI